MSTKSHAHTVLEIDFANVHADDDLVEQRDERLDCRCAAHQAGAARTIGDRRALELHRRVERVWRLAFELDAGLAQTGVILARVVAARARRRQLGRQERKVFD